MPGREIYCHTCAKFFVCLFFITQLKEKPGWPGLSASRRPGTVPDHCLFLSGSYETTATQEESKEGQQITLVPNRAFAKRSDPATHPSFR